jgi:hypothetical protein
VIHTPAMMEHLEHGRALMQQRALTRGNINQPVDLLTDILHYDVSSEQNSLRHIVIAVFGMKFQKGFKFLDTI